MVNHENERASNELPTVELVNLLRSRAYQAALVERNNFDLLPDGKYKQPNGTFLSHDLVTVQGVECLKIHLTRPIPEEEYNVPSGFETMSDKKISILVPKPPIVEEGKRRITDMIAGSNFFLLRISQRIDSDLVEPIVYMVNNDGLWPLHSSENIDVDDELATINENEIFWPITTDEMQLMAIEWLELLNEYNISPFDTSFVQKQAS